jgi:hypothetical protein
MQYEREYAETPTSGGCRRVRVYNKQILIVSTDNTAKYCKTFMFIIDDHIYRIPGAVNLATPGILVFTK